MSWTSPASHIYATGEVVTASTMNTYIEANLVFLGGSAGASVLGGQTTTSTTYTDLSTVGPAVTLNTLTTALVSVGAYFSNNTSTDGALMSFAVSGATTLAANDNYRAGWDVVAGAANIGVFSQMSFVTGLTAGSNTFTAKYRANGGGTATFGQFGGRFIAVIPLTT
jgi:hypothetical protein